MLLTPTEPNMDASKISYFAPLCANKYAEEKEEKNVTVFTKCHGELLTTMSDY